MASLLILLTGVFLLSSVVQSNDLTITDRNLKLEGSMGSSKHITASWSQLKIFRVKMETLEGPHNSDKYYVECKTDYSTQFCQYCNSSTGVNIMGKCLSPNSADFKFVSLNIANIGRHVITFYGYYETILKYVDVEITGVSIEVPSYVEGIVGDKKSVSVTWSGMEVSEVRMIKSDGQLHYSTKCSFNPYKHICITCQQEGGAHIETNCGSAIVGRITFSFNPLKEENFGFHVIEMKSFHTGHVAKRMVKVSLPGNSLPNATTTQNEINAAVATTYCAPIFSSILILTVIIVKMK